MITFARVKVSKIMFTHISSGLYLIKQLFHSRLVGYEVKIAHSALRASSAITSYPTRVRGIIVNYSVTDALQFLRVMQWTRT